MEQQQLKGFTRNLKPFSGQLLALQRLYVREGLRGLSRIVGRRGGTTTAEGFARNPRTVLRTVDCMSRKIRAG